MNKSESIAKLAGALAKAQSEFPVIGKDSSGYNYKYASLDKVIDAVRPVLTKNELSFVQMPGTSEHIDQISLTSMLIHSSGEYLEETMTIPVPQVGKANAAQCYGAGLTYARRYSLEGMLGITSQEDTDATGKAGQSKNGTEQAPQLITDKQRRQLHAVGTKCYGDEWDDKRVAFSAAFHVKSSNDWTTEQATKIIDGMNKIIAERAVIQPNELRNPSTAEDDHLWQ